MLPAEWPSERYRVPARDASDSFRFQTGRIDPAQLREEITRYPCLWPQFQAHFGKSGITHRAPLRSLSRWHLALALAAGEVSGVVHSNDGTRVYVIKGDTHKIKRESIEMQATDSGDSSEIRTLTDQFIPVIRALDFTPGSPTFGKTVIIR